MDAPGRSRRPRRKISLQPPLYQEPAGGVSISVPSTASYTSNGRIGSESEVSSESHMSAPTPGLALDPYARSYVPLALTSINHLYGNQIDTLPVRKFNFDSYVPRHVGLEFLPPIPSPPSMQATDENALTDHTIPTHYSTYFESHIEAEMLAQDNENAGYSLYEHDVTLLSLQENGEATCCFYLPGVRENSPFLEEDDIIQFRQLTYESMTQRGLWLLNTPAVPNALYTTIPTPQPRWNYMILNGRITGIHRKEEMVYVRILGLQSHQLMIDMLASVQKQVPCKFNIQFPTMKERFRPMQQVLPVVQWHLGYHVWSSQDTNGLTMPNGTAHPSPPVNVSPLPRSWLLSMLCPVEQDCVVQAKLNPGSFVRKFFDTELNWEQKKATESVCLRDYGTLPFLISGPPGTGKTKTLVEIAVQLMRNENSHILFCAPSDPAADTLAQRLSIYCKPGELLRLNRTSRTFAEVPNTILPFCYIAGNTFSVPPFRQLMTCKIVVASVRDTSMLMYARVTNTDLFEHEYGIRSALHPHDEDLEPVKLHWTALLMDEAAQGIEPEALVPLSIVAPPPDKVKLAITPIFVMAGDEYQLGPHVALKDSPLKTSLFARLFAREVYANHPLARNKSGKEPPPLSSGMLPILRPPFANLIRNYRSHPAILAVPSSLFYADTLEPQATSTDRLVNWTGWKGKHWPVLFHNNASEDEHEIDGGGWYNKGEADLACTYAASLVHSGMVQQNEVCIMSPFKAQVKRMRNAMRSDRFGQLFDVDIGPTEAFQGLERGVVILCTTRTKKRFVKKDQELEWGIVGTPNKMNVAITRAKFGLIVIGKKDILEMDESWIAFMNFCARNDLWEGEGRDSSVEGTPTRLERMLLGGEEKFETERRLKALKVWGGANEDQMWLDGVRAAEEDMGPSDEEDEEGEEEKEAGTEQGYEVGAERDKDMTYLEGEESEEDYEYHESLTGLKGLL